MSLQDWIKNNLIGATGKLNSKKCSIEWIGPKMTEEIIEQTSFLDQDVSMTLRIRCILDEVITNPLCPICSIPVGTYQGRKFKNYCSKKCSDNDPKRVEKIICNTDYYARNKKTRSSNLIKYGVEWHTSSEEHKEKVKISLNSRYGVNNVSQIKEIKEKKIITLRSKPQRNWMEHRRIENTQANTIIELLDLGKSPTEISNIIGIAYSTVYNFIKRTNRQSEYLYKCSSYGQKEVNDFIYSLGFDTQLNSRIISPLEIDIYIPEKQFGIEYNGIYWHSVQAGNDKNYHYQKYKSCLDKNISLINIFENEWIFNRSLVESMLKVRLGVLNNRLYARQTYIEEISKEDARKFHELNHINGFVNSSVNLGLYKDGSLYSVLSLSKSRYSKEIEYEITRFSSLMNFIIVGGFQKLFSRFIKIYNPKSVITYSDLRWGRGKSYEMAGFINHGTTSPNYFYCKRDDRILESRVKYQKHKLEKLLDSYNEDLTEFENMNNNGYLQIYDCGNQKYIWKKGSH